VTYRSRIQIRHSLKHFRTGTLKVGKMKGREKKQHRIRRERGRKDSKKKRKNVIESGEMFSFLTS